MNQSQLELFREQIERRRKRGVEEIARIVNLGKHPLYSTFRVTSISSVDYMVQIRSISSLINTCTCPDYRTNTLGTCKHIEGVLQNLEKRFADTWDDLVAHAPIFAQIYVHHAGQTTVRMTLPLPRSKRLGTLLNRYFDSEGILQGKAIQSLRSLLKELEQLPSGIRNKLIVGRDVHDYLMNLQDMETVRKQKEWFLGQVKNGARSLNIISTPLYDYQKDGVLHLAFGRRVLLADDMGLGKTVQAIAAVSLLKQLRDIKHVLIIAPASLKHQWAREIKRFTSLPVQVIEGPPLERRGLYRALKLINIITYELVRFDGKELFEREFDLVILDEAQRIKNWRTKTANMVKRLKSQYTFVLTGTPLENRLDELYSIFQFIDPTILGPLWRFNERYYEVNRRPSGSYKVLGHQNLDELRRRIGPYVLRRLREEVLLDLPERIDNNFFVEMTPPQIDAYREYESKVARLAAQAKRRPLTPAEHKLLQAFLVKMRLICDALALHDPEITEKDREKTAPKLRELREILSEEVADNGNKALIFSQWTSMLGFVEPILQKLGIGFVKLTGKVPSIRRGELVGRFFEDPRCKVFLSSDAGGVGLNLQAASMVINLDLPWNPAVLEQRIGRAHRHGQSRPVNVVNLIAKGTIEERMLDTLAAKRAVFDAALNDESTVSELSFDRMQQSVLQRLEVLMGTEIVKPELELTPVKEEKEEGEAAFGATPDIAGFTDVLVGRYPGRIVLVREAPQIPGARTDGNLLVVVDRDPGALRPEVEGLLQEHYRGFPVPALLIMEQEGYRALSVLAGGLMEKGESKAIYKSSAITGSQKDDEKEAMTRRVKRANGFFDTAQKRIKLAHVLLEGGFPEEVLRPLREGLNSGLNGHLSLLKDDHTGEALPSARVVESQLVEPGRVPLDLAARVDRVRVLTTPSDVNEDDDAPPPSTKATEALILAIQELVDLGREHAVKEGL